MTTNVIILSLSVLKCFRSDYSNIMCSVAFEDNLTNQQITARGYIITLARAPHSAYHQVKNRSLNRLLSQTSCGTNTIRIKFI